MLLLDRTEDTSSLPHYQLRVRRRAVHEPEFEVWQLPAPATPHLKEAKRLAGLAGSNLALVEHWLLKRLRHNGIDTTGLMPDEQRRFDLSEDDALRLGLVFRLLAPMRNRDYMRACLEGIEAMGKEEAAYWLGMAMHRKYPRRVLMALRYLLIDPRQH
ncbi:MAG: hypothetical protein HYX84_08425 [Chloroflexi bacterium]|nr:hypothetical protein [Chloroflexota bacterium]